MHLHSIQIQNSKQGVALIFIYFMLIIVPIWGLTMILHKWAGSLMFPALRPGPDHYHMAPQLIDHLKKNNFENKKDFLGRRTGLFYKNFCRQMNEPGYKP